jgi:hypothetical protein
MIVTHSDDLPGIVAQEPERCHDCHKLICRG